MTPALPSIRALAPALRGHGWLFLAVSVHALIAAAVGLRYGIGQQSLRLFEGYLSSLLIGPLLALTGYALYVILVIRPRRLLRHLCGTVRTHLTRARLGFALPALLLLPVFISSFTLLKAAVPLVRPSEWDRRLATLDLTMHGGTQPWQWLQHVLGYPPLTALLNASYHLWFFVMFAIVYWLVFCSERAALRMQFLLSFVLSWALLGNALAMLFPSAGPCYFGLMVDGANPYAGLMQYLHQADRDVPLLALRVQDLLWNDYLQHSNISGLSISAMPSMHVASAVLLALLGWRLNRACGIALTVFAVLILLGSVHLGWHYAVDGYVGAAGAIALWWAAGRLLQPRAAELARTPARQHNMAGLRHG